MPAVVGPTCITVTANGMLTSSGPDSSAPPTAATSAVPLATFGARPSSKLGRERSQSGSEVSRSPSATSQTFSPRHSLQPQQQQSQGAQPPRPWSPTQSQSLPPATQRQQQQQQAAPWHHAGSQQQHPPQPQHPQRQGQSVGPSPVGSLCARLPRYVRRPPIEAVVFAWGVAEDGQAGHEPGPDILVPKVVDTLLGVQFSGRAFGRTPLIAGSRNTLGIDADGQVWSWGWNERGTLGHGHRGPQRHPRRVQALTGVDVVQVALGGWHCLALSRQGHVYAWGGNEYLQCGVERDKRDVLLPVLVAPLEAQRVRMVSCGGMHSLALTAGGTVWTWGDPCGEFAMSVQREPRQVPGAVHIAAVACGAFHNMALTSSGAVLTWGTNDYGQLGNGNTSYQTMPRHVLEGVTVADIAAGGWHSVAITSEGALYTWGRGEYGRLGLGDRSGSSKLRPQKLVGLEGHVVVQASAGGTHSVVLTSTGRVFIWGRASFGRLGLNSGKDIYSPMEVILPGGHDSWRVAAVAAGGRHTMCLALPIHESAGAVQQYQFDMLEDPEDDGTWGFGGTSGSYRAGGTYSQRDGRGAGDEEDDDGSGEEEEVVGGGSGAEGDEEDEVDGASEPSLYDKDTMDSPPGELSDPPPDCLGAPPVYLTEQSRRDSGTLRALHSTAAALTGSPVASSSSSHQRDEADTAGLQQQFSGSDGGRPASTSGTSGGPDGGAGARDSGSLSARLRASAVQVALGAGGAAAGQPPASAAPADHVQIRPDGEVRRRDSFQHNRSHSLSARELLEGPEGGSNGSSDDEFMDQPAETDTDGEVAGSTLPLPSASEPQRG